jgi:hypothetical protein
VRTPLHPQAFRHQVKQDNELLLEIAVKKRRGRARWKLWDYAWCSALCVTTIGTVTDHRSVWIPVGLMGGRVLMTGVHVIWDCVRSTHAR